MRGKPRSSELGTAPPTARGAMASRRAKARRHGRRGREGKHIERSRRRGDLAIAEYSLERARPESGELRLETGKRRSRQAPTKNRATPKSFLSISFLVL